MLEACELDEHLFQETSKGWAATTVSKLEVRAQERNESRQNVQDPLIGQKNTDCEDAKMTQDKKADAGIERWGAKSVGKDWAEKQYIED